MADAAERWGVIPRYTGYQGNVVESPASTIEAIVRAMADGRDEPSRLDQGQMSGGRCTPPPERGWGWAIQLYAARSNDSWGIGALADLRRLGRWARSAGWARSRRGGRIGWGRWRVRASDSRTVPTCESRIWKDGVA